MSNRKPRIILVTGANRGIGFAIVQALASNPETANSTILLGCRDGEKGQLAIEELRQLRIASSVHAITITIDVTSDTSIRNAVASVEQQYGYLDVLINNAGYAAIPSEFSQWRDIYSKVYNTNVTSVALTTQYFLPLLRLSPRGGQVINISSARGSITLSSDGTLSPTVSVPYSLSKTALNMLTVEMSRDPTNNGVEFQMVSPGHCKTAFNGYRGTRDPLEGANVVVVLVMADRGKYKNAGFWETRGASMDLVEIPW